MAADAPIILALAIRAPLARADLPGLYARVCALLREHRPDLVVCDVRGVAPDAIAADALSRLRLAARRNGCRVRLEHASAELQALLGFMGLDAVLPG